MAELSEYILEPLREAADFTLYCGRERGKQMPILAPVLSQAHQRGLIRGPWLMKSVNRSSSSTHFWTFRALRRDACRLPISGAITNANVCLRKLENDRPDLDEVRAAVTRFGRDARRAAEIIARIRSQFEKGSVNRETFGVSEMIRETVALLRDEATRYNISVRTELAADLPQIVGDRVQLQQVAMNLIVNSIEAMKDLDGIREMVIKAQLAENERILVSVSDTGPGFPPDRAEQIFDPFFTTKPHGTGMGLRISRSIIESHGGRLWAEGAPGRGATFHLNLPAAIPGH